MLFFFPLKTQLAMEQLSKETSPTQRSVGSEQTLEPGQNKSKRIPNVSRPVSLPRFTLELHEAKHATTQNTVSGFSGNKIHTLTSTSNLHTDML